MGILFSGYLSSFGVPVPDEIELGMQFPLKGIDVSCEYTRQPDLTTPAAFNVRSFDIIEERGRGGGRPGLSRFLDETVNGTALIQHLAILVDPTTAALGISGYDPAAGGDPTNIVDPSGLDVDGNHRDRILNADGTPGVLVRYIRSGGSGFRHRIDPGIAPPPPPPPPGTIQLVDTASAGDAGSDSTFPVTADFSVIPPVNRVLVVEVTTRGEASGITISVSNGSGGAYTQIGSYQATPFTGSIAESRELSISLWKRISTGGAAEKTVKVTSGTACPARFFAMSFSNVDTTTPITDNRSDADDGSKTIVSSVSLPSVSVSGSGSMVFALFASAGGGQLWFPGLNGFTIPFNDGDGLRGYCQKAGVSTPQTPSIETDNAGPLVEWVGIGFSLKKS